MWPFTKKKSAVELNALLVYWLKLCLTFETQSPPDIIASVLNPDELQRYRRYIATYAIVLHEAFVVRKLYRSDWDEKIWALRFLSICAHACGEAYPDASDAEARYKSLCAELFGFEQYFEADGTFIESEEGLTRLATYFLYCVFPEDANRESFTQQKHGLVNGKATEFAKQTLESLATAWAGMDVIV
jgi:hypothetical protein